MPRFAHKRVGYLAANQCFTEDTEVVLLCTNHLQKEFKSQNPVRRGGGAIIQVSRGEVAWEIGRVMGLQEM